MYDLLTDRTSVFRMCAEDRSYAILFGST